MRVLHFIPVYAPAWHFGGPVLSVSRLCESLVDRGINVHVITTNAGIPDLPPELLGRPQLVNGVTVTYYPVDNPSRMIYSSSLLKNLDQHILWADVIHISSIWQPLGIPIQKAAHRLRTPVIQTLRGALGPYSWRRGWYKKVPYFLLVERLWLQRAAAIHCTTDQESQEIRRFRLKPPVYLISNPCDFSHLRYDSEMRSNWRTSMGIPDSEHLFIVVGRLHHKKGLLLLPKVLSTLTNTSWRILFVGNDADGTGLKLRALFQELGLSNRCYWKNLVPSNELCSVYNGADTLLLPSLHENFGNVVLEALACGCAALLSDKVGIGESLSDCPGVHITGRDVQSWHNHIVKLMSTNRPNSHSERYVRRIFSTTQIATQAIQLYSELLANA